MKIPALIVACSILAFAAAQVGNDGFQRERNGKSDALRNSMEGKAPPSFQSNKWLNVKEPLTWASLKGKVVVIDFWAYW